jgi:hypothetical protein
MVAEDIEQFFLRNNIMGYRSSVSLVLKKGAFANFVGQYPDSARELIEWTDHFRRSQGDIFLYWNDVKWYKDSYKPISDLQDFMDGLEWGDYQFIRIGEELADNEERGSYYDNIFEPHIVRNIDFDFTAGEEVGLEAFM